MPLTDSFSIRAPVGGRLRPLRAPPPVASACAHDRPAPEKAGRAHLHVVWSRIDAHMRVISDSHNYRRHELVAHTLDRAFHHAPCAGVDPDRGSQPALPSEPPQTQPRGRGGMIDLFRAASRRVWERVQLVMRPETIRWGLLAKNHI